MGKKQEKAFLAGFKAGQLENEKENNPDVGFCLPKSAQDHFKEFLNSDEPVVLFKGERNSGKTHAVDSLAQIAIAAHDPFDEQEPIAFVWVGKHAEPIYTKRDFKDLAKAGARTYATYTNWQKVKYHVVKGSRSVFYAGGETYFSRDQVQKNTTRDPVWDTPVGRAWLDPAEFSECDPEDPGFGDYDSGAPRGPGGCDLRGGDRHIGM